MKEGLTLDFSDEIEIDGNHKVFEDTPFKGYPFKFIARPLDADVFENVKRKYIKVKNGTEIMADADAWARELFNRQVTSWSGLLNKDGSEFSFTPENKKLLFRKKMALVNLVNAACLTAQLEVRESQGDEIKN